MDVDGRRESWNRPSSPLLHTEGKCGAETTPVLNIPEDAEDVEIILNNLSPTAAEDLLTCSACNEVITTGSSVLINGLTMHPDCFKCNHCSTSLAELPCVPHEGRYLLLFLELK